MIVFTATIETTLVRKRDLKKITNLANRLVLIEHREDVLPLHFEDIKETKPGGEWGYKPRTKEWQESKRRIKGHSRPLVFSQEMRDRVLTNAKVTATYRTGTLRASWGWAQHAEEITAISGREEKEKAERWLEIVATLMERPEFQRKKRHRDSRGQFTSGN